MSCPMKMQHLFERGAPRCHIERVFETGDECFCECWQNTPVVDNVGTVVSCRMIQDFGSSNQSLPTKAWTNFFWTRMVWKPQRTLWRNCGN